MALQIGGGKTTLIDVDDFPLVCGFNWWIAGAGYVMANKPGERGKVIYMHRFILNAPCGFVVDHKNRNRTDNRRSNLRLASASQNQGNSLARNARGLKGVTFDKRGRRNPWVAKIAGTHLGSFATSKEAAKAYDSAAKIYFGEFAFLNYRD